MPHPEAIIVIADQHNSPRKTVRITTMRDGSFALSMPYHPDTTGHLSKVAAPNILTGDGTGWAPFQQSHRVDSRVKLTYHASGFVQFSSAERNRIRSGRGAAAEFYVPKGLGIQSHPIAAPIDTGPSCGVTIFDLNRCQPVEGSEKARLMTFREGEFFERGDHEPGTGHNYTVSVFVFPIVLLREARIVDGEWIVHLPYGARTDWTIHFRVLALPTPLAFLGIVVERRHLAPDSMTGYTLLGPRDIGSGLYLVGHYPAGDLGSNTPSLAWPQP